MWQIPAMWRDGECWIIGGGASIQRQFGIPEELSLPGRDLSEFSPYLQPIHDRHIIGVNAAFMLGNWVSLMYFGDRSFFNKNMKRLYQFPNLKIRHANLSDNDKRYHHNIKRVDWDIKLLGLCEDPRKIYWNRSSGGAAVNIAAHLGVKRINLLGFDMKPHNGETHWHNHYGKFRTSGKHFNDFLLPWHTIARDAKKWGIEILNVNPDSAIDVFPKVNLKDVL